MIKVWTVKMFLIQLLQQCLLILVKSRLQKNANNSLVVLATIHQLLDKAHPLAFLYIHLLRAKIQKQKEVKKDSKLILQVEVEDVKKITSQKKPINHVLFNIHFNNVFARYRLMYDYVLHVLEGK